MEQEQINRLRISVADLKDEVAVLKLELDSLRTRVAADMKKVVEAVKKNVG